MRLIPVIDLLDNQAVHAVKGNRKNYRPVKSVLSDTPDPLELARAFRARLGLNEIYIADLNAIQGSCHAGHRDLIAALARAEKMSIIVDAGISDAEDALRWLDLGIGKAVVGSETLCNSVALREIPDRIDPDRLVFSLDSREGRILSPCPELKAISHLQLLERLQSAGWREVILLDLSRVGSGEGFDRTLVTEARGIFPDLKLLVGGGIAGPEQLIELEFLGVSGVLVATALHRGIILPRASSRIT